MSQQTGRRVLVADDDASVQDLVATHLRLAGCHVETVHDGEEACRRIEAFQPEAMVLDLNMPLLDGFGVLAWMRDRGFTEDVRTLVLTARNAPGDVSQAIGLGARDYLAKPFQDAQLVLRVARLLVRSREALYR